VEKQADLVRHALVPSALASALGLDSYVSASGYKLYLAQLRQEAGLSTDPVENILFEQVLLCHLSAAELQGQVGQAKGLEVVRAYAEMAARLMAECRKTALALKSYRTPPPAAAGCRGPTQTQSITGSRNPSAKAGEQL
jgi:hypothetical protein